MAAKTLREAILIGLTSKDVYLTESQTRRLEGELRDFFVHQLARSLGRPPINGSDLEKNEWELRNLSLTAYFHSIFKDVASYQGGDDE